MFSTDTPQQERTPSLTSATVIVPRPGSHLDRTMIPGSGIVALPLDAGRPWPIIYYETNLMGASNLNTLSERVQCAFTRAAYKYPTSAMRAILTDEVVDIIPVGVITWPGVIKFDSEYAEQVFRAYETRFLPQT